MTPDFKKLWEEALPFSQFLTEAVDQQALWEGVYRTNRLPAWAEAICGSAPPLKLLTIAEDWCGDAANTVPIVERFAEAVPCVEHRIIKRDEYPDVMDRYLTNGSRSIPIVIVLDEDFQELGHWGPRPTELQAWVMENKATLPPEERYPKIRRWYAKDRGETTLREVLAVAGVLVPERQGVGSRE